MVCSFCAYCILDMYKDFFALKTTQLLELCFLIHNHCLVAFQNNCRPVGNLDRLTKSTFFKLPETPIFKDSNQRAGKKALARSPPGGGRKRGGGGSACPTGVVVPENRQKKRPNSNGLDFQQKKWRLKSKTPQNTPYLAIFNTFCQFFF